jgi:FkbM family methyltransferase
MLEENIRMNAFDNVEVLNAAVADRRKSVQVFAGNAENIGQSTTIASTATTMGQKVEAEIEAYPLDALVGIDRLRRARLIKVDIEGAEAELFDGMRALLPSFGEDTEWIFELAPQALQQQGRSVEEILEMFTSSGYRVYLIENSYRMESYARAGEGRMERISKVPERRKTLDVIATKRETAPRVSF